MHRPVRGARPMPPGVRRGLLGAVLLPAMILAVPAQPPRSAAGSAAVEALRGRAREILDEVQALTLSLTEARIRVERLLRDLEAVGEAEGWAPVRRQLEVTIARPETVGLQIEEECPPLPTKRSWCRLCPLDQSRSEIWGKPGSRLRLRLRSRGSRGHPGGNPGEGGLRPLPATASTGVPRPPRFRIR